MNKQLKGSFLLILAAFIWGTAFVAQSEGVSKMGVFGFTVIRNYMAVIVLTPIILFNRFKRKESKTTFGTEFKDIFSDKKLIMGGLLCGIALCFASNLQQIGIKYVSFVGKSGFLTALYIIFVPIAGLFFHKRVGKLVWVGLVFAVVGLYLLCMKGSFVFEFADIMLILCAVMFTVQIMLIDSYVDKVDGVELACIQFFFAATLSLIPMLLVEHNTIADIKAAAIPLIYAGVFSSGIAFTLQIVAQKDLNPTLASMIMSLESVFSVLAGMVILGERSSSREYIGCVLMFVGVILAQLPEKGVESSEVI